MSRKELGECINTEMVKNSKAFTVHAALDIGNARHITIFYNDRCDCSTVVWLSQFIASLPIGRKIQTGEIIELYNPKNPKDPLLGIEIAILNKNGNVDHRLMDKIATFSDEQSWRQQLDDAGEKQFQFKFHTTLGLKSEIRMKTAAEMAKNMDLIIVGKYIKTHIDGTKYYF